MIKKTRWPGMILLLIIGAALLVPGSGFAMPAGAPPYGMVCTPGVVAGSTHTFNLNAGTGYVQTPDGNSVFMWGYADASDPDPLLAQFQSPGPVLCVTQGETVVVNLTNNLPDPVSIIFPGQDSQVGVTGGSMGLLTAEAAASGGTASYTFVASQPGTYIYQSGTDISKQVEMGLYGALIVRPSIGAGYAYDTVTQFDPSREYMLLLAEIDPDLHHAVEVGLPYDFTTLHNRYFTINGRSFPDTIQDNGTTLLPNQPYGAIVRLQPTNGSGSTLPALIRLLNVGADNHPFHPHGNHTSEIAQDGRRLLSPTGADASTERFDETIGSGQTEDYLIRWDDQDNFNPINNPFPVEQPNYQNLTFKDANTWYSGAPYLGYKGTLPTGTNSFNICGEWYFPFHSHALNEFSNYDLGFGGMGTLLRVDPSGGCFTSAAATTLLGGAANGDPTALAQDDASYLQVSPQATTLAAAINASTTTLTVASSAGFPAAATANPASYFYVRINNEVMQVTNVAGNAWTVCRSAACRLGTTAASHSANAATTALSTDWTFSFSGVPVGAQNLKVTYKGENCGNATGTPCAPLTSNLPIQTTKVCDWTIAGAAGCSTPTGSGWVTMPFPQMIAVGSVDVSNTWTLGSLTNNFIGTGANLGEVRILVHTQRWTASSPTPFSTWANLAKLVYDAP